MMVSTGLARRSAEREGGQHYEVSADTVLAICLALTV
jgi:hypothetical protein